MIDAAIQAAAKRIIPSEFSTNLLPILCGKPDVRDYITSVFPTGTGTIWSSVENRLFFEMCLEFGSLGPSIAQKTAAFRNGGDNVVGTSRLSDIAIAMAKLLDPAHFEEPKSLFTFTGIEFKAFHVNTEDLIRVADAGLEKGDIFKMVYYYLQMTCGKGCGDTRHMSWNERLGLKTLGENDIKDLIRQSAQELGIVR